MTERAALPDEQFGRERLGLWADKTERDGLNAAQWAELADPAAERGNSPTFAVATGRDRSWSAVAVAWWRPDDRVQVMLADYQPGTAWVAQRVAELRSRWGGQVLVDLPSRGLVDDALEPTPAEQAQADNELSDRIHAGTVRHGNEAALNTAVRGTKWRPSGDTRVLVPSGHTDISPVVAAALAVHGLTTSAAGGWMVSLR